MKIRLILFAVLLTAFITQNAFAIPSCQKCPYSCSDLGLGKKDCSFVSDAGGICCVDLSKKGMDIAAARAAVTNSPANNPSTSNSGHGCPSGFRPGPRCSDKQRRNGCKDLRGSKGESCNNL